MGNRGLGILLIVVVVVIVAYNSVYVIKETERGVLLKFGEVVVPNIEKGLHFKIPMVHKVRKFDARILTLDSSPERFLTVEKKPLDVDFYAKWRVVDTLKFYTATNGEEMRADRLLAQRINDGLRNQFGERTVHEVVSGERDLLMVELTHNLNEIAISEFGIEVVDIRVKRIDLPEQVSQSVFARMRSEREREASEHRATGREQAEFIRAAADRERTVIQANAYSEAERIRGDGDARAAEIYAKAYNKDPEFYKFMRSLQAYRASFQNKDDILVVDAEGDFFKYLKQVESNR